MPRRTVSRLLLSLLLLWQLGAGALAHPAPGLAAAPEPVAESCHGQHHAAAAESAAMSADRADHAPAMHTDACKSLCKCACAGIPALSFMPPAALTVDAGIVRPAPFAPGYNSAALADPLRPPI